MRDAMQIGLTALVLAAASPGVAAKLGAEAPPFTLKTFDGTQVSLTELRGQVVVLNFWATWCGPCKAEMPALDAYVRSHPGRGLRIFAVATEDSVPAFRLKPLQALLSFPLVAKLKGGSHYGPIGNAVPTSYVIDRAGVIRYAKAAAFTTETLDAVVAPLLAEARPASAPPVVSAAR